MNKIKCTVDMASGLPCHWWPVNFQWIIGLSNPRIIEPSDKRTLGLSKHYRCKCNCVICENL